VVNTKVLKYCVKFAWNDITSRKVRSFLTVLGILIGVSALVALMSVGLGMRTQVEEKLTQYLGIAVFIRGESVDVPVSIVPIIERVDHVTNVFPVIQTYGTVDNEPAFVLAIPAEEVKNYMATLTLLEGRLINESDYDAAIIDYILADRLGVDIGDTVVLSAGTIGGTSGVVKVVGVVDPGLTIGMGEMGIIVTPIEYMQDLLNRRGYASLIMVQVDKRENVIAVAEALQQVFPNAKIRTSEELIKRVTEIIDIINVTLLSIASISLIVAALSVMNTIMMVVRERVREIGILKAIGASKNQVLAIFLSEALLFSLMGGIGGIVVGAVGANVAQKVLSEATGIEIPPMIQPEILALGLLIAMFVGMASALYPAYKGALIKPVEALRYE